METKNVIIRNYAQAVNTTASDIINTSAGLNDNMDESKATIAILNVILESMRSHIVLLQQALDSYNK